MDKKEVLNSKLGLIKLNERLSKLKKKAKFVIQSLLFPKKDYTLDSAKKWAGNKGYKTSKITDTKEFIHLRQKLPTRFNTYRTISLGNKVKARIAGNMKSKFAGNVYLKGFSKFSEIKSELDLKIPMEVEMKFLCEGTNRDGNIKREDLEESLNAWSNLPIIDWHNMEDMKNPTEFRITDKKGYLGNNPTLKVIDGKQWIMNTAYITDRYLAYLIYLSDKQGTPYEVSPEYGWTAYYMGGTKYQANIHPHIISIVDKGHIEGNKLIIKDS